MHLYGQYGNVYRKISRRLFSRVLCVRNLSRIIFAIFAATKLFCVHTKI